MWDNMCDTINVWRGLIKTYQDNCTHSLETFPQSQPVLNHAFPAREDEPGIPREENCMNNDDGPKMKAYGSHAVVAAAHMLP